MPVDPEYLREHYASLSDEALLEIKRAELVEVAQRCYDDEVRQRQLARSRGERGAKGSPSDSLAEEAEVYVESLGAGDKPGWLEDASEVFSIYVTNATAAAPDTVTACDVLKDAGIPSYLDLFEDPPDTSVNTEPRYRWRVLVPGKLNLRATSVLERDIYNPDFENEWKTLLETLSDRDLRAMSPHATFCGLIDKIERVKRVYDEEIRRRGLK